MKLEKLIKEIGRDFGQLHFCQGNSINGGKDHYIFYPRDIVHGGFDSRRIGYVIEKRGSYPTGKTAYEAIHNVCKILGLPIM